MFKNKESDALHDYQLRGVEHLHTADARGAALFLDM